MLFISFSLKPLNLFQKTFNIVFFPPFFHPKHSFFSPTAVFANARWFVWATFNMKKRFFFPHVHRIKTVKDENCVNGILKFFSSTSNEFYRWNSSTFLGWRCELLMEFTNDNKDDWLKELLFRGLCFSHVRFIMFRNFLNTCCGHCEHEPLRSKTGTVGEWTRKQRIQDCARDETLNEYFSIFIMVPRDDAEVG